MTAILSPRATRIHEAKSKQVLKLNAIPPSLTGRTIGFLDNGKKNFDVYLGRTEELLRGKYTFRTFSRRKPVPIKGITPEVFHEMIATCDVVITGSGD